MKKFSSLILAGAMLMFISLYSCMGNFKAPESIDTTASQVSPDSLIQLWNAAWNANDSTAIANMFNNESVVLETQWQQEGADSIMQSWVLGQLPQVSNLKTEKVASGVGDGMAFYTGFYTLDVTSNDSIVGKANGNFTTIWKLQDDKSWKVKLIHLDGFDE